VGAEITRANTVVCHYSTLGFKDRKQYQEMGLCDDNFLCDIWITASNGVETWTLWIIEQKHLESKEMWCWRRMERLHGLICEK